MTSEPTGMQSAGSPQTPTLPSMVAQDEPGLVVPPTEPAPWGFWMTVVFTIAITIVNILVQGAAAIMVLMATNGGKMPSVATASSSGLALASGTVVAAPIVVGLCLVFAFMRRGITVKEYLALRWPPGGAVFRWILVLLGFLVASDTLTYLLGRPIVPKDMVEAYLTAGWVPILWLALIVGAPFAEEFLVRGFLFTGIAHSRLGSWGAIGITAILWASLHVQYDLYGILMIFVAGLLLGVIRLKTQSLWLCILLHAVMNFLATLELVIYLAWSGR